MDSLVPRSISILLAVGIGCELATASGHFAFADQLGHRSSQSTGGLQGRLMEKCCQIGREKAVESAAFNCKLSAVDALKSLSQAGERASQLVALSGASLLKDDPQTGDQCEMLLESCCLAHHRTRNCDSGKQFAKSGSACMDVELSKEATVATESFNDCCMSCSLGILAARQPSSNETSANTQQQQQRTLNERCKLISPLASSLSGQLYEQTYLECCQENLPRVSGALLDSNAPVDCSQAANACQQRCLSAGSLDPTTGRPLEQDRCDCFSGFRLGSDGLSCNDIDECKLNLHTCNRQSEVCDNTRGSFKCLARTHSNQQQTGSRHNHHHHHHHHHLQPTGRSLSLDEQPLDAHEQPAGGFASLRLCPLGSRWLASENRCKQVDASGSVVSSHSPLSSSGQPQDQGQQDQGQQQQQHWNTNQHRYGSSSTFSSSRWATSGGARLLD